MTRSLSATSYAILGLLAIQPWTPYELTRQMSFSLGRFWPRAESKLYEEPKKLLAHGFAIATPDDNGRRRRTRYEITDSGRAALQAWLATPAQALVLEAEPLVRVFLAEHGTKAGLLSALKEVRSWAASKLLDDARIARGYLEGEGQFPHRIAQVTLVGRFLNDFALMAYQWSEWALRTATVWPEEIDRAPADREALDVIAARAELVSGEDPEVP